MANCAASFPVLSILILSFYSGKFSILAAPQRTWCIAKPAATDQVLQGDKDFSCNYADCSPIEQGGSCFNPNTLVQHTSFAMNSYYQIVGRHQFDCDFESSSLVALTDPSSDSCSYIGGDADVDTSKTWCVAKPTASNWTLQFNIDFACRRSDCNPIKTGGVCFNPNTILHHASYAMNNYYQKTGRNAASCDFNNSGIIVASDPRYGGCFYTYASHI